MNPREIQAMVAAVITTALETEPDAFPEALAYLAAGSNFLNWDCISRILTGAELVTIHGNAIRLTDKGRDLARKINAALENK